MSAYQGREGGVSSSPPVHAREAPPPWRLSAAWFWLPGALAVLGLVTFGITLAANLSELRAAARGNVVVEAGNPGPIALTEGHTYSLWVPAGQRRNGFLPTCFRYDPVTGRGVEVVPAIETPVTLDEDGGWELVGDFRAAPGGETFIVCPGYRERMLLVPEDGAAWLVALAWLGACDGLLVAAVIAATVAVLRYGVVPARRPAGYSTAGSVDPG